MAAKTMEFNGLLSLLPACDGPSSFPFDSNCQHFRYEIDKNPRFVAPTLRVEREPADDQMPSVVVISASAAVGKSTIAQAIAYELQAPLWDLSQFTLGDGTFTGIPRKYFGSTAFNDVETRLRSGSFLYVLDALDEARAKSGHGLESFLQGLCDETKSAKDRACLVLLGRTEACMFASLYLEEKEVPFAHYYIDFFSRRQSEIFIDKYLDRVAEENEHQAFHRIQRPSFVKARDSLFLSVRRLLSNNPADDDSWNEDLVREFIGYAPVLEVLADFLNVPNYYGLEQQMAGFTSALYSTNQDDAWKFLRNVVASLLDREQTKLVDPFRSSAEAEMPGWNAWDTLYGRHEQCERVLSRSFGLHSPNLPQQFPLESRKIYEDAISIPDHVFVKDERHFANVVFRDYLFSWALKHGSAGVRESTKSHLAGIEYSPSPLLAHFYITMEPDSAESDHLGHIYESLLSKEIVSQRVTFTVGPSDGDHFLAVFRFEESGVADISFPVTGAMRTLVFRKFLRNADITFPGRVSLGLPDGHFDLGPAVRVKCEVLHTAVSELRVITARNDGGDVVLESRLYEPEGGMPPDEFLVRGDGTLYVSWPNMAFPWVQYQFVSSTKDIDDSRLLEAFQRFASILAPFRGRGFGGLTRAKLLIDNRPVGGTPMGRAMRDHLVSEKILIPEGGLYRLNQRRLSELNVTWKDIQLRKMSDKLCEFLKRFLGD